MITAWRLEKKEHVPNAFTGEGARRVNGRWHHHGIPVVYVSQTLSLATLEKFVHVGLEGIHIQLISFRVEIPSDVNIQKIGIHDLPEDWRAEPPSDSTRDIGTRWAREGHSPVLRVPSVIIPVEWNYLLNPLHPEFRKIRINDPEPFSFDPRMWKTV